MTQAETTAPTRVALITGSARGIGKEIALTLGQNGYAVMLSDVNAEQLEKTVGEFRSQGIKTGSFVANVSKSAEAEALVEETIKTFGRIDLLVNNAGITKDGLLLRMTEEQWDAVINVNLKGTFLLSKAVCRPMLKQKSGCVVNIASVIGLMGNAGQTNYAASKAGIIAFTKSYAKEFARKGIRANAVAPGFIMTEMTSVLPEQVKEEMLRSIPMGTLGSPRDVANAVLFLASDQAAYITGQVLTVDGGMVMS
ncbi:MAG TPA: 3-oxoacyl-[acyl-carrier-protein] reductase [Candidatus Ozemobacteraceae bacterium]|nr:3-oxoacyl-[acyl-carrier-protein] reductase [Candidatus Ozemobacteraceae bacterium]